MNIVLSDFKTWFTSTLLNGAIGSIAGKVMGKDDKFVPRKFTTNAENDARTVAGALIGSWGNNLATAAGNKILEPAEKSNNPSNKTSNENNANQ